jgi:hypothetical protein
MKKIKCEGVGDNDGFFECAAGGLSDSNALVMPRADNVKISESELKSRGFKYTNLGDDSPYETWEKHGIVIWNFTNPAIGDYWLIDLLDQAGIDKELYYMHELESFFSACGLDIRGA